MRRRMLEIGREIIERLMRSETPVPLSKIQEQMGTHFNTLKNHLTYIQLAQRMPKVTVRKVGRQVIVETEKSNEDIEFLREIIGEELPPHVYLLVDLLDNDATTFDKAVPLSLFPSELKLLDEQAAQQRVVITTHPRVYLTPLGVGIAKGAKRYISLTHPRQKIPPTISFQIPTSPPTASAFRIVATPKPGAEILKPKVKTSRVGGKIVIEISIEDADRTYVKEEE